MITFVSKAQRFQENIQRLWQDLITKDGIMNLGETEVKILTKLQFLDLERASYKLNDKGSKAFMKALKEIKKRGIGVLGKV